MKKARKTKANQVKEPLIGYVETEQVSVGAHNILAVESSRIAEPLSRVETFRSGFRKRSFERLKEVTGLDNNTLAQVLSVSSKTLQRTQVFDVVQSERMYELAELYSSGINYFGQEDFRRWMERPLFSIGNRKPKALIDVSEGISLLKTEIMRLQHGISV